MVSPLFFPGKLMTFLSSPSVSFTMLPHIFPLKNDDVFCSSLLSVTVNGQNPGSRPQWSMHTWWTTPQSDNRALLFLDNNGLS